MFSNNLEQKEKYADEFPTTGYSLFFSAVSPRGVGALLFAEVEGIYAEIIKPIYFQSTVIGLSL